MQGLSISVNALGIGSVKLDGVEISRHVRRCEVTIEAGQVTRAVLSVDVCACKVTVDNAEIIFLEK